MKSCCSPVVPTLHVYLAAATLSLPVPSGVGRALLLLLQELHFDMASFERALARIISSLTASLRCDGAPELTSLEKRSHGLHSSCLEAYLSNFNLAVKRGRHASLMILSLLLLAAAAAE